VGRALIIFGLALLVLGLLVSYGPRLPLGRLPGDIAFKRGNFQVYFPLATSIIVSIVLTLVFWLVGRR
jgi:hypothetical protein